jgi:hypothetical protein
LLTDISKRRNGDYYIWKLLKQVFPKGGCGGAGTCSSHRRMRWSGNGPDAEMSPPNRRAGSGARAGGKGAAFHAESRREELEGYRWPRESVWKTIMGEEMEFILYHGNGGQFMCLPPGRRPMPERGTRLPIAPVFSVSKQFLVVNNPKWYRAHRAHGNTRQIIAAFRLLFR